jgi:hypothetical protein
MNKLQVHLWLVVVLLNLSSLWVMVYFMETAGQPNTLFGPRLGILS